jgi:Rieske Fe-S protein
MAEHLNPERREFLRQSAVLLGAGLCVPALLNLVSGCSSETKPTEPGGTVELDISTVPELQSVGGAIKRTFGSHNGGRPVLIIRLSETGFIVFSAICTHEGCEVELPQGQVIPCLCHGSRFATTDGRVLQGPAKTALQRFASQYDPARNVLTITF